jgi:hypothetical protein
MFGFHKVYTAAFGRMKLGIQMLQTYTGVLGGSTRGRWGQSPLPLQSPKTIEAERLKGDKTEKEKQGKKKERKGKEQEKGKKRDANLLFILPSCCVDMAGFIGGGGRDCAIMHDEGLLFYTLSLFSRVIPTGAHRARACLL